MTEENYELTELLINSERSNEESEITSIQSPNFNQDLLLLSLINNNKTELGQALNQATEIDFIKKREHTFSNASKAVSRNIFTIACLEPTISPNTLYILFNHIINQEYDYINLTEESWYYWQPIHFAAYSADANKLDTILNILKPKKLINTLSIFSENALHVLLEYGRRKKKFYVQLTDAWKDRICNVIPTEKSNVLQCAKLLIDAGVDVNHNNIWNETPLTVAIKYRLLGVIKLILKTKRVDLDTCKDSFTGKSARDLLREDEICLDLIAPNIITVTADKVLFTYLKVGDEEAFLRYNNKNISQYVDNVDGKYGRNIDGTMLHLCLIKGYTAYKMQSPFSQDDEADIIKTKLLNFFCEKGLGRCIEHLLNNDANISSSLLRMVVKLNYYPFLVILLQHKKSKITEKDILSILKILATSSIRFENSNTKHILYLLINKLEIFYKPIGRTNIDKDRREILNNILDLYLTNGPNDKYKNNICQIFRLGGSLVRASEGNVNRLKAISFDTLREHLDDCIGPSQTISYDSLIEDVDSYFAETAILHYLSKEPTKIELLSHPTLAYLIHAKWEKAKYLFYLNIIFYFVYLIVLYFYMVQVHTKQVNIYLFITFVVCLIILIIKEFVQLTLNCCKYLYDVSNYLEIVTIGCCFITILCTSSEISMILAILLSTLSFLLMLGQMPRFSKYLIIFSSTKYFLKYALFYFLQFFSFSLCFFIMLSPAQNIDYFVFGRVIVQLFETLFFFIGQFEGDITNPTNFPIFGRIVVAVFVFCMSIMLNNLLVGLIVTDMDLIHKTSKELSQVRMIKSIRKIEKFLSKLKTLPCTEGLLKLIGSTKIFKKEEHKILVNIEDIKDILTDGEKEHLKSILNKQGHKLNNILKYLYDYIIYYSAKKTQNNSDVMLKLSRLEDQ